MDARVANWGAPCSNFRHISRLGSYARVSEPSRLGRTWEILILREIRGYIRRSHAVMMTVTFAVLYALGAMTIGGMLILAPIGGGYQGMVLWGSPLGIGLWNYPALIITAPWGYIELPFFATFSMIVVSIGVALGMAVAILLGVSLLRSRRRTPGGAASVGSIAGLTPAMIGLVTIGACCSTTAASVAGIGLVAGATGTTVGSLLLENWYLGVFQIVVVWLALFAQEIVLRVYGGLLGRRGGSLSSADIPRPTARRAVLGGGVRGLLLIGGVTWSLTTLAEWTTTSPWHAPAGLWLHWIVQQQIPGLLAIFAGLVPGATYAALTPPLGSRIATGLRAALFLAGMTLMVGTPPPIAAWGIEGFGNELLAVLGAPAAWGAVAPVFAPGPDLYFRWAVQYLLAGGFAIVAGLQPARAFALWIRHRGREPFGARAPDVARAGAGTGSPARGPDPYHDRPTSVEAPTSSAFATDSP